MSVKRTIQPSARQEAESLLLRHRMDILKDAGERAQTLARDMHTLNNTQIQALLNAVGGGPGRQGSQARRRQLAQLLAQRSYRERSKPALWTTLAANLVTEIEELERRCQRAQESVRNDQAGYWQRHADVLRAAVEEMRMQVVESFLYTLERWVLIQRAQVTQPPIHQAAHAATAEVVPAAAEQIHPRGEEGHA